MSSLWRWASGVILVLVVVLAGCVPGPPAGGSVAPHGALFCFWNTENFFDDHFDHENRQPDKDFDTWFSESPKVFAQKVKNLTEVLRKLNDGRGPDIIALAELESERAARILADALNEDLPPGMTPYDRVLWENPHGGRSIATAILTRLPVQESKTHLLGRRLRILEGHIEDNGQELIVLATHWTSRVSDKEGKEGHGRALYADQIYGRYKAMYQANPKVCMLICGDFNDNPDDPSVTEHLHAVGDVEQVRAGGNPPPLFDLFAERWQKNRYKIGTHFYRGKGNIFDQIVVSPAMIDGSGGWSCEVETATIVKHRFMHHVRARKDHPEHDEPLEFGTPHQKVPLDQRGASDHLPVTVRLMVSGR